MRAGSCNYNSKRRFFFSFFLSFSRSRSNTPGFAKYLYKYILVLLTAITIIMIGTPVAGRVVGTRDTTFAYDGSQFQFQFKCTCIRVCVCVYTIHIHSFIKPLSSFTGTTTNDNARWLSKRLS